MKSIGEEGGEGDLIGSGRARQWRQGWPREEREAERGGEAWFKSRSRLSTSTGTEMHRSQRRGRDLPISMKHYIES